MTTAALGGTIEVPTVDGERARISIPPGTQTGETFRLRGKGMTILRQPGARRHVRRGDGRDAGQSDRAAAGAAAGVRRQAAPTRSTARKATASSPRSRNSGRTCASSRARHPAPGECPGRGSTPSPSGEGASAAAGAGRAMRIGVAGCAGRMGRMLMQTVLETTGASLAGGIERPGHSAVGGDLGALAGVAPTGIRVGDDPSPLFAAADVVIDFSIARRRRRECAQRRQRARARRWSSAPPGSGRRAPRGAGARPPGACRWWSPPT